MITVTTKLMFPIISFYMNLYKMLVNLIPSHIPKLSDQVTLFVKELLYNKVQNSHYRTYTRQTPCLNITITRNGFHRQA